MAKFIFQLDGVLRHRTNIEHQRKRELAFIQAQMTAFDNELRTLDLSVRASIEDLRKNRLIGRIDLAFLAAHRRFTLAMQRKAMGIAEKMVKRIPNAKFILIPTSDATRGHGTHTMAAVWKDDLAQFMQATEPKQ